jgi:hypothetical protein
MPLVEGLSFVDGVLVGAGIRDQVRVIASGKVLTGFSLVRNLSLGADVCNSARAMLFALGCIQALKCDTNKCPTGITTQDKELTKGLDVPTKSVRVASYQRKTVEAALDIIGAIGLESCEAVERNHVMKRVSISQAKSFAELYPLPARGSLVDGSCEVKETLHFWHQGKELNTLMSHRKVRYLQDGRRGELSRGEVLKESLQTDGSAHHG